MCLMRLMSLVRFARTKTLQVALAKYKDAVEILKEELQQRRMKQPRRQSAPSASSGSSGSRPAKAIQ